jgi:ABC-type sulfate/molybdate transport systems ATPase subunit
MLDADFEVERRDFTVRAALQVGPGERLALFGPSGAGKTTVLEVIAGLVLPSRGRVVLGERVLTSTSPPRYTLPPWQRRVGLLRQDPGLFPHLSVLQNLTYASGGGGTAEVREMAASLGIAELASAMPRRLSGGQAHRVALGRLLLAPCDALLLDEPFSGLDESLRRTLTGLVASLVSTRSIPSLLVAHELSDAQAFADRLAVLDHGGILQVGRPGEVVRRPASQRVAELVGYLGFVPVRGRSHLADAGRGKDDRTPTWGENAPVADDATAAGTTAGVHPERVIAGVHPQRGLVLTGEVVSLRPAGGGWEADLRTGSTTITCRLPDKPATSSDTFAVTALDPPLFGADGFALTSVRSSASPVHPEVSGAVREP